MVSAYAQTENPFAVDAQAEYQRKWTVSETREQIEARCRRIMPYEMRDGTFLNEYTTDDEWMEPLQRILTASYGNVDQLACLVVGIREQFIQFHAERQARIKSED